MPSLKESSFCKKKQKHDGIPPPTKRRTDENCPLILIPDGSLCSLD